MVAHTNFFDGMEVSTQDMTFSTLTATAKQLRDRTKEHNNFGVVNGLSVFTDNQDGNHIAVGSGVAYDPTGERIKLDVPVRNIGYNNTNLNSVAASYNIVARYVEGNDGTTGLSADGTCQFRHLIDSYSINALKVGTDPILTNDVLLANVLVTLPGSTFIIDRTNRNWSSPLISEGGIVAAGTLNPTGGSSSSVQVAVAPQSGNRIFTIPDPGRNAQFIMDGNQTITGPFSFAEPTYFADGSAGNPSISFTLDPDTGIYRIASNTIGITAGGTNILTVAGTGRLGINTSPIKVLDIRGASDGLVLLAPTDDINPTNDIFQLTSSVLSNTFSIKKNGTLALSDGTAAAPIVSFAANTGVGMYRIGTNDLGFATSGVLALEIDPTSKVLISNGNDSNLCLQFGADASSSANVHTITNNTTKRGQIGYPHYTSATQAPVAAMVVISDSSNNTIQIGGGSTNRTAANIINFITATSNTNTSGGTTAMTIFASGNSTFFGDVNVNGSTSPNFYVTSTSVGGVQIRLLASTTAAGYIQTQTNHPLIFTINNSTNAIQIYTDLTVHFGSGGTNNASISTLKFPTDSAGGRWGGIQGFRESDAANIHLSFYTMAGDTGGVLERMRINNTGEVGIGITAVTKLHVATAGATSAPASSGTAPSTGTVLRLMAASNAVLDIGSNSSTYAWLQSTDQTGLSATYPLYLNPNGGDVKFGGNIQFGTQQNGIIGCTNGTSANAGIVGEAIRSYVSDSVPVSASGTTNWNDITSISLTAGDWDVTGTFGYSLNGATQTGVFAGISSTTGNSATGLNNGDNRLAGTVPTSACDSSINIAAFRVVITGTTTYYLKFRCDFSAGTPKAYGRISARRVR